ncbi:MAG: DUF2911 domain-containing protein [Gemmatimonadaceae bacterium]|jgi:hypothetical protein|nr:DUF2911 domain-containing protein [Gemmatimonadaceae bacterium]
MRPSAFRAAVLGGALCSLLPLAVHAQAAQYRTAPSGFAVTEISINRVVPQGTPADQRPKPLKVRIEYGQPHARGRTILGGVVPMDSVWRLGANAATSLTSDVDLVLGGTSVPKGAYTLFAKPTASGWRLIVNRKTGEWGTQYDASADLAAIPATARTLADARESFTLTLVPESATSLAGKLVFAWGTFEVSVPYEAKP